MAVVMLMKWDGVRPEQYEEARKVVNWEGDPADGAIFHVAAFSDGALHVTDLWDSADAFNRFVEQRLMPGTQKIGIQGQPDVKVLPAHNVFTPAPGKLPALQRPKP
jgi:hypothetical protein